MSTEVVMPQMGESIAEGTITKWLKKVGDRVEQRAVVMDAWGFGERLTRDIPARSIATSASPGVVAHR